MAPVFFLSGQPLCDIAGDGQLEALTLVGFDHAVDPQEKREEAKGPQKEEGAGPVHAETTAPPPPDTEREPDNGAHNVEAAEGHDRLRRVVAHVRPTVNQIEDYARQPAQHIAEQRSRVFR